MIRSLVFMRVYSLGKLTTAVMTVTANTCKKRREPVASGPTPPPASPRRWGIVRGETPCGTCTNGCCT